MAPLPIIAAVGSQVVTGAGHVVKIEKLLSAAEKSGIQILVAASSISLFAVLALLTLLASTAIKSLRQPTGAASQNLFARTHVVAYFVSLLLCDVISAIGSLMNANWVSASAVSLGQVCTMQGALKNTGNVGSAMWSMVIAIHTFCLLVLKWRSSDRVLYITLGLVWAFIGTVVLIGAVGVQNMAVKGPYYGIAGYWCWITDAYGPQRVVFEYFWMFLSAFTSLILYTSIFLSLRGNLVVQGWKVGFQKSVGNWDKSIMMAKAYARHMIMYPITYLVIILPISLCRFLGWSGHKVPFEVMIFADTIFLLSGFINVVLFSATRRLIPPPSAPSHSRNNSDIESQASQASNAPLVKPFLIKAEKINVSPIRASVVPERPVRASVAFSKGQGKEKMGLKTLSLVVMMANRASKAISPTKPRVKEVQPSIQIQVNSRAPPPRNVSLGTSNPELVDVPLKTPNPSSPSAQVLYVPPTIPVPSLQPRKPLPKRGVSVAPTLKSVYSQPSDSEDDADSESETGSTKSKAYLGVKKMGGVRASLVTPPMPRIMSLEERMKASSGAEANKGGDSGYSSRGAETESESEGEKEERAMASRFHAYEPASADIGKSSLLAEAIIPSHRLSLASRFSDDPEEEEKRASFGASDVVTAKSYATGFATEYSQSSAEEMTPPPVPQIPTQHAQHSTSYQLTAGLKSAFSVGDYERDRDEQEVPPPLPSADIVPDATWTSKERPLSSDSMESPAPVPMPSFGQRQREDPRKSYGLETVYSQDSADERTPPPLPTTFVQKQAPPSARKSSSKRPILRLSSPSDTVRPLSIMKRRDSRASVYTPISLSAYPAGPRSSIDSTGDRTSIASRASYRPLPVPPTSAHPSTSHSYGHSRKRSNSSVSSISRPLPRTPLTAVPTGESLSRSGSNASGYSLAPPQERGAGVRPPSDASSLSVYSSTTVGGQGHGRMGSVSSIKRAPGTPF